METEREHEVAEMVGRELELPAVWRQLERGQRHHAGVVDEDVERSGPGVREGGDRGRIGEVQRSDVNRVVAGRLADLDRGALAGVGVADGQRDRGAGARERAGGFDADPGRGAGDDCVPAGEIDALDHLGGRRLESEWGLNARG